ncbi:MAG: phosphatase [Planctomyces sp.]|nr:phosphatase [Planctomyces sp.]
MAKRMQMNDQITVGPQPTAAEIESLPKDGFQSVINFRTAGEEDQPFSPEEERDRVEAVGMNYLHVPVSMDAMDSRKVDDFREKFKAIPKPLYAHCKTGKRAGAMVMMHTASEQGMTGEEALQAAEEMGFECDVPELKQFVKSYVDQHANT